MKEVGIQFPVDEAYIVRVEDKVVTRFTVTDFSETMDKFFETIENLSECLATLEETNNISIEKFNAVALLSSLCPARCSLSRLLSVAIEVATLAAILICHVDSPVWLLFMCFFVLGLSYRVMLMITLVALIFVVNYHYHSVVILRLGMLSGTSDTRRSPEHR